MDKERRQEEGKLVTKRIVIFLALTFGIAYLVEIGGLYPLYRQITDQENYDVMSTFNSLLSFSLFVPAISALLTRLITREGVRGQNLYLDPNTKGNGKYYLFSWFGVVGLSFAGSIVYYIMYPAHFDFDFGYVAAVYEAAGQVMTREEVRQTVLLEYLSGIFIAPIFSLLTCFGEEWGFRGYLLPMLLKKFKVIPTLFISGIIWGLWNIPLVVMGYNYGEEYAGYPYAGILAMCLYCIVMGIVFSFLCIRTGSCIPAIIAHAALNGFAGTGNLPLAAGVELNAFIGPKPTGVMGGLGFIIAAAVMLALLIRERHEIKSSQKA